MVRGAAFAFPDFSAVVGPVQQGLALAAPAQQIARLAFLFPLPDLPPDRLPALDLPLVLRRHAATHVVAAVPLEPAARVVVVEPAFLAPDRKRLACVDAEEIQRAVAPALRQ